MWWAAAITVLFSTLTTRIVVMNRIARFHVVCFTKANLTVCKCTAGLWGTIRRPRKTTMKCLISRTSLLCTRII